MTCEIDKLFQCITNDDVEMLGSFLEEVKKNITVEDLNKHIVDVERGRNCLHQIVSQRNPAILKLFLQTFPDLDLEYPLHGKEGEKTALHLAVSELSETLLSDETDPKKEQKTQPNIFALLLEHLKTQTKYEDCKRKFFLENVVNKTTKEGISVLDYAVQNGLVRETCLLLDMEVFSYREDQDLQMFLLLKRSLEYDQPIMAEVLLQYGAIPDFMGEFAHNTLLRTAIKNQQLRFVEILLEHGAGIGEEFLAFCLLPLSCRHPFVFGMSIAGRLRLVTKDIKIFNEPVCDQSSLEAYENKLKKIREKLEAITIDEGNEVKDFSDPEKTEKNIINAMNIVMDPEDIEILFHQLRFVFVNKIKLRELSEDDHRSLRVLRDLLISLYVEKHAHAKEKEEEKKEMEEETNIKRTLFKKVIEFGKSNKKIIDIICSPPYERLSSLFQRIIEVDPKKRDQLSKYQQYCSARIPVKSLRQLCIDVMRETEFDFSSANDEQITFFNKQLQDCDPKGDIFKPKYMQSLLLKNQDQIKKIVTALRTAIKELEELHGEEVETVSIEKRISVATNRPVFASTIVCFLFEVALIILLGVVTRPHSHDFLDREWIPPRHRITGSVSQVKYWGTSYSETVSTVIGEETPSPDFPWSLFLLVCIGITLLFSSCCLGLIFSMCSHKRKEVLKDYEIQEEIPQEKNSDLEKRIEILMKNLKDWLIVHQEYSTHAPFYKDLEKIFEEFEKERASQGEVINRDLVQVLSALEFLLNTVLEEKQKNTSVYDTLEEGEFPLYQSLCFFKSVKRSAIQKDHVDSDNGNSSGKEEIELREIKIDTENDLFEKEEYENISSRGVNTSDEQKLSLLQNVFN